MRVFSLAITAGVLQLVDDDRDDGKVATRMGDGNGEKDEVKAEPAVCVGNVPRLLFRRPSFVPPLCSTNPLLATHALRFFLSHHGVAKRAIRK